MPFESPDLGLGDLLAMTGAGKVQLPDFQRPWKWDDDRILSLLATVTLGYPLGVMMTLETGGPGTRFKPRPLEGTNVPADVEPEQLLMDGQQRLTSLYQALRGDKPVDTMDARGKRCCAGITSTSPRRSRSMATGKTPSSRYQPIGASSMRRAVVWSGTSAPRTWNVRRGCSLFGSCSISRPRSDGCGDTRATMTQGGRVGNPSPLTCWRT